MIRSWVVNLQRFLLPDGGVPPLPPRAQRLFARLLDADRLPGDPVRRSDEAFSPAPAGTEQ